VKFPVGSVGMSHCGFESRGRSFLPCCRFLLPDRLAEQQAQVFITLVPVTEKTKRCSLGVALWMGLHHGGEHVLIAPADSCIYSTVITGEGLAVALPIRPVTYTSVLLQNYVLFFCASAYCGWCSLCFPFAHCSWRLSVCIQPGFPGEGRRTGDIIHLQSCQEV